jgi:hypothetical protein
VDRAARVEELEEVRVVGAGPKFRRSTSGDSISERCSAFSRVIAVTTRLGPISSSQRELGSSTTEA